MNPTNREPRAALSLTRRCLVALGGTGALLVLLLTLRPSVAFAGAAGCTITTTPVTFGIYNTMDPSPLASTGSINYFCGRSAQAKRVLIWVDRGLYSPTNNPRRMGSGTYYLEYNLYLDAAHTAIWGDPNPNQYISSPANRVSYEVTVYGLIPALQDVPSGTFSDRLLVTINW
jgi:spore coat protein U-like protein